MDEQAIERAAAVISTLAERHRLTILVHLRAGELKVGEVQQLVRLGQPQTSYHLRCLFDAGLVRRRQEGQRVYYSIDADGWDAAVAAVRAVLRPSSDERS